MSDITQAALEKGVASFMATSGRVPPSYEVLIEHAPQVFAGYGLIRDFVMRSPENGGALDVKTKELIFALLEAVMLPRRLEFWSTSSSICPIGTNQATLRSVSITGVHQYKGFIRLVNGDGKFYQ